jgi:hypothetical protein
MNGNSLPKYENHIIFGDLRGLPASGPLARNGRSSEGYGKIRNFFKPVIETDAGRPFWSEALIIMGYEGISPHQIL